MQFSVPNSGRNRKFLLWKLAEKQEISHARATFYMHRAILHAFVHVKNPYFEHSKNQGTKHDFMYKSIEL